MQKPILSVLTLILCLGGLAMGRVYLEDQEPKEDEEDVIELQLQDDEAEEVDVYDPSEDYEMCEEILSNLTGEA